MNASELQSLSVVAVGCGSCGSFASGGGVRGLSVGGVYKNI